MKTGCFFTATGPGRIGIARRPPRGYELPHIRALAPGSWFNSVTPEVYRDRFFREVLAILNPRAIIARAIEIAGDAEPILLCWEKPPFTETNWCHRRMVAEWLEQATGEAVPEVEVAARASLSPPPLLGQRPKIGGVRFGGLKQR